MEPEFARSNCSVRCMSSDSPTVTLTLPNVLQLVINVPCVYLGHGHLWTKCPYVNGSCIVNVNKKVQLDATICRHLFTGKSLYMFRASQHPSSGALKTVTATSGIGHNTGTDTSFQRGLLIRSTKNCKRYLWHRS